MRALISTLRAISVRDEAHQMRRKSPSDLRLAFDRGHEALFSTQHERRASHTTERRKQIDRPALPARPVNQKSRTPLTTTRMLLFGPTLPVLPDHRNFHDMRRVAVDARTKSRRFVEACRRGIVRSQPEVVEAAAGCRDDVRHQPSGHPESAEVRQHVEMPDPADTL